MLQYPNSHLWELVLGDEFLQVLATFPVPPSPLIVLDHQQRRGPNHIRAKRCA